MQRITVDQHDKRQLFYPQGKHAAESEYTVIQRGVKVATKGFEPLTTMYLSARVSLGTWHSAIELSRMNTVLT